jgi:hypothetical protein
MNRLLLIIGIYAVITGVVEIDIKINEGKLEAQKELILNLESVDE